jgi:hypothetical protein
MRDPEGIWETSDGIDLDFCRECCGSGRDLKAPPCMECGAMTLEEADNKCKCAGDKDWCYGCQLWPEDESPNDKDYSPIGAVGASKLESNSAAPIG